MIGNIQTFIDQAQTDKWQQMDFPISFANNLRINAKNERERADKTERTFYGTWQKPILSHLTLYHNKYTLLHMLRVFTHVCSAPRATYRLSFFNLFFIYTVFFHCNVNFKIFWNFNTKNTIIERWTENWDEASRSAQHQMQPLKRVFYCFLSLLFVRKRWEMQQYAMPFVMRTRTKLGLLFCSL